jgi:hypothetical protein
MWPRSTYYKASNCTISSDLLRYEYPTQYPVLTHPQYLEMFSHGEEADCTNSEITIKNLILFLSKHSTKKAMNGVYKILLL